MKYVDVKGQDDCWNWIGYRDYHGYGKFSKRHHKPRSAPQFAYEMAHGGIPDGLWILHHCDNPACVNPKHLYAGTVTDNNRDKSRRGRCNAESGEQRWNAKLTDKNVSIMRRLHRTGKSTRKQLAKRFGVTESVAYAAISRRTWKHVK